MEEPLNGLPGSPVVDIVPLLLGDPRAVFTRGLEHAPQAMPSADCFSKVLDLDMPLTRFSSSLRISFASSPPSHQALRCACRRTVELTGPPSANTRHNRTGSV